MIVEIVRADLGIAYLYNAGFRMEFPVGKLVALGDGNDVIHVRQKLQVFCPRVFFLSQPHADDRDFLALGEMCGETVVFNKMLYFLDVFGRSMGFHYDNHIFFILFIFFMQQVKQKKITATAFTHCTISGFSCQYFMTLKCKKYHPQVNCHKRSSFCQKNFKKLLVKIE